MLYNLLNEIKNNFEPEIIKEKGNISIEENEVIFEITTIENFAKNNNINNEIGECENIIRMDFNMSESEPIYLLNMHIDKNSNQAVIPQ